MEVQLRTWRANERCINKKKKDEQSDERILEMDIVQSTGYGSVDCCRRMELEISHKKCYMLIISFYKCPILPQNKRERHKILIQDVNQ